MNLNKSFLKFLRLSVISDEIACSSQHYWILKCRRFLWIAVKISSETFSFQESIMLNILINGRWDLTRNFPISRVDNRNIFVAIVLCLWGAKARPESLGLNFKTTKKALCCQGCFWFQGHIIVLTHLTLMLECFGRTCLIHLPLVPHICVGELGQHWFS